MKLIVFAGTQNAAKAALAIPGEGIPGIARNASALLCSAAA